MSPGFPLEPILLIDGREPVPAELAHLALVNLGHFTAMQVRGGAVRGLDLHLARLRHQHTELYGAELDPDHLRDQMRDALRRQPDAYLRVTVFEIAPGRPLVLTAVRPPVGEPDGPVKLLPVEYVRPFAHTKHVGTFAQIRHGILAHAQGFDDALLVSPEGMVAETTVANIAFVSADRVTWPLGHVLRGITWQLLQRHAPSGLKMAERSVAISEIGEYEGAVIANSTGLAAVSVIGDHRFDSSSSLDPLVAAYRAIPLDVI